MRQSKTSIMVNVFSSLLIFLLLSFFFIILSEARSRAYPHPIRSFNVNPDQATRSCSYMVTIKTSCSSPSYTNNEVSLTFGDVYDNQVHVPRLDDPLSRTFARCSTDTFHIQGSCPDELPAIYLRRLGSDGWKPESLKIEGPNGNTTILMRFEPMDFGLDVIKVSSGAWPPWVYKEGLLWYRKQKRRKPQISVLTREDSS